MSGPKALTGDAWMRSVERRLTRLDRRAPSTTAPEVPFFIPVVGTSISYVGTAAGLGGTTYSITNATRFSINGIFTADYEEYRISANISSAGADSAFTARFRVGGVDAAGGSAYGTMLIEASPVGMTSTYSAASSARLGRVSVSGGIVQTVIQNPMETGFYTMGMSDSYDVSAYQNRCGFHYGGGDNFDGISFFATNGFTGTINVVARNN